MTKVLFKNMRHFDINLENISYLILRSRVRLDLRVRLISKFNLVSHFPGHHCTNI